MADHDAGIPVEAREATHDRRVVGKHAVAVQLLEIREDVAEIVERVGPLRVPRHLRDLPRAELPVDVLRQRLAFLLELRDLRRDVDRGVVLDEAQLLDLRLELGDRLLEVEKCRFHTRCGARLTVRQMIQYCRPAGTPRMHRSNLIRLLLGVLFILLLGRAAQFEDQRAKALSRHQVYLLLGFVLFIGCGAVSFTMLLGMLLP